MKRSRESDEDLEDIDVSNIIQRPRRKTNLKWAFELLKNGDVDGFLGNHIIKDLFFAAFTLLGNFGHGTNVKFITRIWKLYFLDDLLIERLENSEYIEGKCNACNKSRALTYEMTCSSTSEYLGIMGTDCYEVKFAALSRLANVCKFLIPKIDNVAFEMLARGEIEEAMIAVREAPIKMKELYSFK